MKFYIQYNVASDMMEFYIVLHPEGQNRAIARVVKDGQLEFDQITPGAYLHSPTFILPCHEVPKLMDAMIKEGVKPTEQNKIEGLYEASQKHLEDMRKLVFDEK